MGPIGWRIGIVVACVLWGLDNNFTRNISAKDPIMIVSIKGLSAGSFSLRMALILGNKFPSLGIILGAMIVGSLSYGLSIVLFIQAMRGLGAARTRALFSTAPFAGMLLSFLLFQEFPQLVVFNRLTHHGYWDPVFLVSEEHEEHAPHS